VRVLPSRFSFFLFFFSSVLLGFNGMGSSVLVLGKRKKKRALVLRGPMDLCASQKGHVNLPFILRLLQQGDRKHGPRRTTAHVLRPARVCALRLHASCPRTEQTEKKKQQ